MTYLLLSAKFLTLEWETRIPQDVWQDEMFPSVNLESLFKFAPETNTYYKR